MVMSCENLKPSPSPILKLQVMGMFVNKMKYPPNTGFSPFFWLNLANWFFLFWSKWLNECGFKIFFFPPIAYTIFYLWNITTFSLSGFSMLAKNVKGTLNLTKLYLDNHQFGYFTNLGKIPWLLYTLGARHCYTLLVTVNWWIDEKIEINLMKI
jgi:hypothetical protein